MGSLTPRASHLEGRRRPERACARNVDATPGPDTRGRRPAEACPSAGRRSSAVPVFYRARISSDAAVVVPHAVDLDLLRAEVLGDLGLLGDRLLVEADALDRHGLLGDDGLLGVEHDLVLLLADRGAVHGVADVGLGDRLALDADLFAG